MPTTSTRTVPSTSPRPSIAPTVSNDPKLRARLFSFLVSHGGRRAIRTYADGVGPWKRYIVSTAAVDLNHHGKVGDENGDGNVDEADRKLLPPATSSSARTGSASSCTPGRSVTSRSGCRRTTRATR